MTCTSSHDSLEHIPECHYEHPVYCYGDYKNYCLTGGGGIQQIQRKFYLHLLTHEIEPETVDSLFALNNNQCECLLFARSQFCFHVLTSREEVLFPNRLKEKGFEDVSAQLGLFSHWRQAVTDVMNDVDFCKPSSAKVPTPAYATCSACSLVLRHARHKCEKGKKDRYGEETSLRYITMFKTIDQEVIELDVTCIPLHWWDFHHLIPTVASIYKECDRLGLQTTILQLSFQDPIFMDLFGMLEQKLKVQQLGVYGMYLYLKFRLLPYLRHQDVEELGNKIFPIYIMVVSENITELSELLGYNRTEIVDDLCKNIPNGKKVIADLFNKFKDEDDNILQNRISDELCSGNSDYILLAQIMNKYRPIYEGVQKYVQFTFEVSPKQSHWFTIQCKNEEAVSVVGNIFGIIPSGSFCPTGDIYKLLMLCSNHPYTSWQLKEKTDIDTIFAALNARRSFKPS